MGIRFYCPNGHRLHVKSFLAGKRGICPHCDARFDIPLESQIPSRSKSKAARGGRDTAAASAAAVATAPDDDADDGEEMDVALAGPASVPAAKAVSNGSGTPTAKAVAPAAPAADPIDEAPHAVWYVRPPSGGQYGPAAGDIMRKWIGEGRVSADSLVWREGWADWESASAIFPSLSDNAPPTDDIPAVGSSASKVTGDAAPIKDEKAASTVAAYRDRRRKSNTMAIATIVLLSLFVVVLGVVLVVVYVMNSS